MQVVVHLACIRHRWDAYSLLQWTIAGTQVTASPGLEIHRLHSSVTLHTGFKHNLELNHKILLWQLLLLQ